MMQVGIVGIGRMGQALAAKLAKHYTVVIYDHNPGVAEKFAASPQLIAATSLAELTSCSAIILALPKQGVLEVLTAFNQGEQPVTLINIATNTPQAVVAAGAAAHVKVTSAKFIGHAAELAAGARPVIVVHSQPAELVELTLEILAHVGDVVVGDTELVAKINTVAAEQAITAAVMIEETLAQLGLTDQRIAGSAISQVAAGIMKAYAANNLGPFAADIVTKLRAQLSLDINSKR